MLPEVRARGGGLMAEMHICDRCGAFNYRSAVTDCCGVIPAHYCANCGAEVVG